MNNREKAIYYLNQGRFIKARELSKISLKENPEDYYLHTLLVWLFKREPLFDYLPWNECHRYYLDFPGVKASIIRAFVYAEQLQHDQRYWQAVQQYKDLYKSGLRHPVLYYRLGQVFESLNENESAVKEYKKALKKDGTFLPPAYAGAKLCFKSAKFDTARTFTGILKKFPTDDGMEQYNTAFKDARHMLWQLSYFRKEIDKIKKTVKLKKSGNDSETAVTLWPVFRNNSDNNAVVRMMVMLFCGNYSREVVHRHLTREMDTESPSFYYACGLLAQYHQKWDEALSRFDQALKAAQDQPLISCDRGLVYLKLEKPQEAEHDFLKALSSRPRCLRARVELADLLFQRGDYRSVLKITSMPTALRKFALTYELDAEVNLPRLDKTTLHSLWKLGRKKEALEFVRRDRSPLPHAGLLYRRAMVWATNRKYTEAAAELSRAIEIRNNIIAYCTEDELEFIDSVKKNVPDTPLLYFIDALKPAFENNLKEAAQRIKLLANRYPENEIIRFHYANIANILGDHEAAKSIALEGITKSRKPDTTILRLYCELLEKEGNLEALVQLGQKLKHRTTPYAAALSVADSKGLMEKVKEIGEIVLKIEPDNQYVIDKMVRTVPPESVEAALYTEKMAQKHPLYFDMCRLSADQFIHLGKFKKSRDKYYSILKYGFNDLNTVLLYGISSLAALKE